jgi:hypothetical protein
MSILEKIHAILASNLSEPLKLEMIGLLTRAEPIVTVYPTYPVYPIPWYTPTPSYGTGTTPLPDYGTTWCTNGLGQTFETTTRPQ